MISLLYGSGLRVSELVHLKKRDIDLKNMVGWVRRGKGNKDRVFVIPDLLIDELQGILDSDQIYLFMGHNQTHISVRTIQAIIKIASKKAKIEKNVHPHTLRHSFATHLIESGYDVATVQSLLGHNEARTTMDYLHMVKPKLINVISPLDNDSTQQTKANNQKSFK